MRRTSWVAGCAALMMSTPGLASAYEGAPVAGGGAIAGKVKFLGKVSPAQKIEVKKDAEYCGKKNLVVEELIVAADKGLANVVVFISEIAKGKPIVLAPASLVNKDCRYEPHVLAVPVGTKLAVKNEDPILHNTHARLKKVDVFNFGLPEQGQVLETVLTQKSLVKVGCDAGHEWMAAYLAVFDHPYFAVTAADGSFSIPDLPPGSYELAYWHEKLGRKTAKLTVKAGQTTDGSLELR